MGRREAIVSKRDKFRGSLSIPRDTLARRANNVYVAYRFYDVELTRKLIGFVNSLIRLLRIPVFAVPIYRDKDRW